MGVWEDTIEQIMGKNNREYSLKKPIMPEPGITPILRAPLNLAKEGYEAGVGVGKKVMEPLAKRIIANVSNPTKISVSGGKIAATPTFPTVTAPAETQAVGSTAVTDFNTPKENMPYETAQNIFKGNPQGNVAPSTGPNGEPFFTNMTEEGAKRFGVSKLTDEENLAIINKNNASAASLGLSGVTDVTDYMSGKKKWPAAAYGTGGNGKTYGDILNSIFQRGDEKFAMKKAANATDIESKKADIAFKAASIQNLLNPKLTIKDLASMATKEIIDMETGQKTHVFDPDAFNAIKKSFGVKSEDLPTKEKDTGLKLPLEIRTTSQAVDYLMKNKGLTKEQAIQKIKENS